MDLNRSNAATGAAATTPRGDDVTRGGGGTAASGGNGPSRSAPPRVVDRKEAAAAATEAASGSGINGTYTTSRSTSTSSSMATPDQRLLQKIHAEAASSEHPDHDQRASASSSAGLLSVRNKISANIHDQEEKGGVRPSEKQLGAGDEKNNDLETTAKLSEIKPVPEGVPVVAAMEPVPPSLVGNSSTQRQTSSAMEPVPPPSHNYIAEPNTCMGGSQQASHVLELIDHEAEAEVRPGAYAIPGLSDSNSLGALPHHDTAEELHIPVLPEAEDAATESQEQTCEIAAYAVDEDEERRLEEENEALRRQVQRINEAPVAMARVLREESMKESGGDGRLFRRKNMILALLVCGVTIIGIALGIAAGTGSFRKDDSAAATVNGTVVLTGAASPRNKPTNFSQDCWAKILPADGVANDTLGRRIAMYNRTIIIGASRERDRGSGLPFSPSFSASENVQRGTAYVYVLSKDGSWEQQDKLFPQDNIASEFGLAVGLHGNTAVIGARWDQVDDTFNKYRGAGYVFERKGAVWEQTEMLRPTVWTVGDKVGGSVAIYSNTIVLGASGDDDATGAAYIFRRQGNKWRQQQKLVASDRMKNSHFGRRVALDANYAAITADGVEATYMFRFSGTKWIQDTVLSVPVGENETQNRDFGSNVDIDGKNVIVGAFRDDFGVGSAYIFTLQSNGTWIQTAKLTPSDGEDDDQFGRHVVIKRDTVFVGSKYDDDNGSKSGSVYIFRKVGDSWREKGKLIPNDGAEGDQFGLGLAVNNNIDTLAISSWRDDDNGYNSGSFYSIDLPCLYDDW